MTKRRTTPRPPISAGRAKHAAAVLALAASAAVFACSSGGGAGALGRLSVQATISPSADVMRAIGIVHYEARRYAPARMALDSALRLAPEDAIAALYLGLASEQVGDAQAARRAYTRYAESALSPRLGEVVAARVHTLARQDIAAAAVEAMAREQTLASLTPPRRVVAVLPCVFYGPDTSYLSLSRGIAELLTTDLSRVSAITVLERERGQAMLAALKICGTGQPDYATASRVGRLLGAGRIVQCTFNVQENRTVDLSAAVVDVASERPEAFVASRTGRVEDVPALAKGMVYSLLGALETHPTPLELERMISDPTTSNPVAFLLFSRGLAVEDEGRIPEALLFYRNARQLDSDFRHARSRVALLERLEEGRLATPRVIEGMIARTPEGVIAAAARRGSAKSARPVDMARTPFLAAGARDLVGSQAAAAATGGQPTTPARDASATLGTERAGLPPGSVQVLPPLPPPPQ